MTQNQFNHYGSYPLQANKNRARDAIDSTTPEKEYFLLTSSQNFSSATA